MNRLANIGIRIIRSALLALPFATVIGQLQAAPGTLAQSPLYIGPAVEPNITFLSDDSGSMDWTLLTPETDGIISLSGLGYWYSMPAPDNDWVWVPVSEEYALNTLGVAAPALGVWRARNADYNKIYYDPKVTYTPWTGVNNAGAAFANVNSAAALVNPYDPAAGTVNLTDPATTYWTDYPGFAAGFWVTNYYPARYYAWTDSDGDGVVDPEDGHTLVEITSAATAMTPVPPASYTGSAARTDCAAAPACTYAEEIQNFANWFSYYRKREYSAKNAIGKATADLTGVRVGYGTINNNNSTKIKVASMNLNPASGNKKALYDKVYQTNSSGMTPLRTKLTEVGKYYECVAGNFFGVSGADCPILPAVDAGMCQKNFAILMTDGYWNGAAPSLSNANTDGNNNTAYDGPPYADSYNNTLADVAMEFYERDLNTTLANEVPPSLDGKDTAPHQHMVTYTVAFGVSGTLDPDGTKTPAASDTDPTDAGFTWPNPASGNAQKIDDLWHAAYNGRGAFFSAQNPIGLAESLKSAFTSAAAGQSSAAAVAFNTTTLDTGSVVYQARFNPSEHWKGEMIATKLDMGGSLLNQLWNAGTVIDTQLPANRLIITYNETTATGVPFKTLASLSAKQQNDLNMGPTGTADALGQSRIDYLRGARTHEGTGNNFRVRQNTLGDIVHANPVYVGKPQSGYKDDAAFGDGLYSTFRTNNINRPGVVYIGANDGMLHGFAEASGAEVMAYAPNYLFSNAAGEGLHYLTDPNYGHRYYADLSPTIADVYLSGSWRTIIIGGSRAGGRGLFALDVTNPSTFSEATANNMVLWEFSGANNSNLGYSFSKPTIALLENGKWAAVFGNGYNDSGTGEAQLFILFLQDGMDRVWSAADYMVISTGSGTAANRNGLSTPGLVDTDGNGKADRVYAGDLFGNLWAFDLSNVNPAQWGIAYKQGATKKALFNANIGGVAQPITSKPVAIVHPTEATGTSNKPNLLVFFGTGQFVTNGDKSNTATQTFYGVWDHGPNASSLPFLRANLVAQTLEASSTTTVRVPTDLPVDYASKKGWQFDLPTPGERVVVNPKVRGEYVFFNTLIPDTATCNPKGSGWLMALKLGNGGRPNDPVFDVNNDGAVDSADKLAGNSPGGVKLDGIPAGSNFLGDKMYTPDDKGNIDVREIDAGISHESGRMSWQEIKL